MARSRNIKPAFFLDEVMAALPHETRLLFIGLSTIADREGRLQDNPRRIGASLFPYESALPVDAMLSSLNACGFIRRYSVAGESFIQVMTWAKDQNPHPKEAASVIPAYSPVTSNEPATEKPRLVTAHDKDPDIRYIDRAAEKPRLVTEKPVLSVLIPDSFNLIPDSFNPQSRGDSSHNSKFEAESAEGWKSFLGRYPNQIGIDEACRQWVSMDLTADAAIEVLAGLDRWRASEQWQAESGKYVPARRNGSVRKDGRTSRRQLR